MRDILTHCHSARVKAATWFLIGATWTFPLEHLIWEKAPLFRSVTAFLIGE